MPLSVVEEALAEMRQKSRSRIYQTDPEAWLSDVVGKRWWSKQREIAASVVNPRKSQTQTIVKSCNGIGKTAIAGDLATWAVAVHDPFETSVLLTAPIFGQIRANTFRYIADNYTAAKARGLILPGRMTGDPSLRVDRLTGGLPKDVIQAKRPADSNLISSFQGTHDGYVMVIMDEAGGLPEDLWIGANAVTTNEHVAILAIGNPDELNTPFHRRFTDNVKYSDWERISVSAYETPNFTGELIYPEDEEKDAKVKSHLIQVDWAEKMKREAHPNVVKAKVYGEFPDDGDTSFFPQSTINVAYDTDLDPTDDDIRILGVDLSFQGDDKTCLYLNHGGKIRLQTFWNKEPDHMKQARLIHQEALSLGVDMVQVDAAGQGGGVHSLLRTQPEFADAPYGLLGVQGGKGSPDTARWAQARSWHYDTFRQEMQMGHVDLDPEDTELRDQLYRQTFKTNPRGAIQITPKDEMRRAGHHSPDHLDAAIYAHIDVELILDPGRVKPGDVFREEPENIIWDDYRSTALYGPGLPA